MSKKAYLVQSLVSQSFGSSLSLIALPLSSSILQGHLDAVAQLLQCILQMPNLHSVDQVLMSYCF